MQNQPSDRLVVSQIESLAVNGLDMARGASAIGFRAIPLLPMPCGGRFENKLILCTLKELGPYDTAGLYNKVSFQVPVSREEISRFLKFELFSGNSMVVPDFKEGESATICLEWTFDGEKTFARLTSDRKVDLMLMMKGSFNDAGVVFCEKDSVSLEREGFTAYASFSGILDGYGKESSPDRLEALLRSLPMESSGKEACLTGHLFLLSPGNPVYVALAESRLDASPATIDALLAKGMEDMHERLMKSSGSAANSADAIQRLVGFASCYNPLNGLKRIPVNRDWAAPGSLPPTFRWDDFFDAYMGCLHNPELARESLLNVLMLIKKNGMGGVSLPSQRNLIIPTIYSKTVRFMGDKEYALKTLPIMMDFMRFFFGDRGDGHPWRDGNDDGLIECGSCLLAGQAPIGEIIQNAFDETGYDDTPMYSGGFAFERRGLPAEGIEFDFHRRTLNLTMVGQNSLYVASCYSMAAVCDWTGSHADAVWLRAEAERVSSIFRERLFNPEKGYFLNRFFNGRFSEVKTMDIFYPLMAGLCNIEVSTLLRRMLMDPAQFWGENVIPTVSRDDPAYGKSSIGEPYWKWNYWRGNVWPPTNYIVYLALRNAGWDDIASELSTKSHRLFMQDWLTRHHANENYPPEGGTSRTHMFAAGGGRDPHYVWSGLLPLMGLEEIFSVEDLCRGLRFGSLCENSWGSWQGFLFHGQRCSVKCDKDGLSLDIPGMLQFSANSPIAVRKFIMDKSSMRFRCTVQKETLFKISEAGSDYVLKVDGRDAESSVSGRSIKFRLLEGSYKLDLSYSG